MRYDLVTMQVFVYPEIRYKYESGRWWLLPPVEEAIPFREFKAEPIPFPARLIPQIRPQDDMPHIDAALWKQRDDYFVVGPGGSRHDPRTIIDYNIAPDPNFSVDSAGEEKVTEKDQNGNDVTRKKYCGPDEVRPIYDLVTGVPGCPIPQYESERVDVIELKLVEVKRPGQEIVPLKKTIGRDEI